MSSSEPWWWSSLTPADTQPLISLREMVLLLDGRSMPALDAGIDEPVFSALRVAEIIAQQATERRMAGAPAEDTHEG
jgi:hypothetical protein